MGETPNTSRNSSNQFWFWLGVCWRSCQRIPNQEEKVKTRLEIVKILAPALIGVGIAWSGQKISEEIANANTAVAHANLLNTFMESLKKKDSLDKEIAFIALKMNLEQSSFSEIRQLIAAHEGKSKGLQRQVVYSYIQDTFNKNSANIRTAASQDIIKNYKNNSEVVELLVNFATDNKDNTDLDTKNGLYNTAFILNEFPRQTLLPHKNELIKFFNDVADENGDKTKAFGLQIKEKIK